MKKRAEMTTQQIVILVVLIASFAVILLFFSKLNFGEESKKDICYNSVVMRSSMPVGGEAVPLNCKREYVCITEDGSCEKMTNPVKHEVETKEEVYQVLADELADCWWMFGEGKLDYVGKDTFPGLYCSICSQVAFDDSVKEKVFNDAENFDSKNFYEFMSETNKTKVQTYSQYLYGTNNLEEISGDLDFQPINLGENYFVMMGITSKIGTFQCGVWGGISNLLLPGSGAVTAFSCWWNRESFSSGVMKMENFFRGRIVEGTNGRGFIIPTLIEANSEEYESLNCKSITTLS